MDTIDWTENIGKIQTINHFKQPLYRYGMV